MSEDENIQELLVRYYDDPYYGPVHYFCDGSHSHNQKHLQWDEKQMDFYAQNLESEGLLDVNPKNHDEFIISYKGKKVVKGGGYIKYISEKRAEDEREKRHKGAIRKRDRWQSKLAGWQVYLFWPLLIIAVLGAVGNAEKTWNFIQKLSGKTQTIEKPQIVIEPHPAEK